MSWSDYNLSDGEFKDKQLSTTCEALRLAIVERCEAASYTVPEVLASEMIQNTLKSSDWIDAFQNTITALIPKFAKHIDNGGDWTGETSIPVWSEADILTEIEESVRIPVSSIFKASWANQQYKILNILRWVKRTFNDFDWTYTTQDKYGYGTSWSEAISVYNNASWNEEIVQSGETIVYTLYHSLGSGHYIRRTRSKEKIENLSTLGKSCDWYIIPTIAPGAVDEWNTQGDISLIQDVLNLYTISTESEDDYIESDWISSLETLPPNLPEIPGHSLGWIIDLNYSNQIQAVLKFDGSNGFQFKDW